MRPRSGKVVPGYDATKPTSFQPTKHVTGTPLTDGPDTQKITKTRLASALAIAITLHTMVIGEPSVERVVRPVVAGMYENAQGFVHDIYESQRQRQMHAEIQEQREALVANAIRDIRANTFGLGRFKLTSEHLDATEQGFPFNLDLALRKYEIHLDM